jgi:PLD-like domain
MYRSKVLVEQRTTSLHTVVRRGSRTGRGGFQPRIAWPVVPTLDFLGQPFSDEETSAAFLTRAGEDSCIESLSIVVAWARFGGLRRVKEALQSFRARGGELRIIVGIDEGGATRPGLVLALGLASKAYVFHDPAGWTFHPKVYLGEGQDRAILLVGSSNATAGGLFGNYEASLEAEFSLPEENDHQALAKARQYIGRLLGEEEICLPLTQHLIDRLVENPRYAVAGSERRRTGSAQNSVTDEAGEDIDMSGSTEHDTAADALFGKRRGTKSVPPTLSAEARDELAALEVVREPVSESGGSLAAVARTGTEASDVAGRALKGADGAAAPAAVKVVKRWYKQLPTTDAQQLDPSTSSGSASATLIQFHHPIDPTTYFRHNLFEDADWLPEEGQRETASVEFDVWIEGVSWGKRQLVIVYDPSFESGQANRTTLLRWGAELNEYLRANDHSDDYLSLERLSDGSYRLTISQAVVGPFMD